MISNFKPQKRVLKHFKMIISLHKNFSTSRLKASITGVIKLHAAKRSAIILKLQN